MFLDMYLNITYLNLLYDKYDYYYITGLNEERFIRIYNLFKKYKFYFIEDIIINYLEIFELEEDEVENKIFDLKRKLGESFVHKIGKDLTYLEDILN